ncbi:Serine-threonine protein kinase 19 [Lasallia pustulata]|uniref:Serine-threonine protein kinase 19 n=1 Tax=Lasallia pustulata TaxID=136370 RepID=A0A1W5CRH8_9LECA|nr:Serine-threonine protein kinase 19 [Lasallia pustulata]
MPLNFSAAHSSRITKPKAKNPLLRRSSSSLFANAARRKPIIQRAQSKPEAVEEDEDFFGDRLDDTGLVTSLATDLSLRDVAQMIRYTRSHMFDPVPERGGMDSTQIAELLNLRKSLPPIVSVAHVHALITSPTAAEREIAELTKAGVVRKISIPGRGTGGSSMGEGVVLMTDWEEKIREASSITLDLQNEFIQYLRAHPLAPTLSQGTLAAADATALMRLGFVTASSQQWASANVFSRPDAASSGTLTSISSISKAASGSMAAIGGESAVHQAGGGSGGLRRSSSQCDAYPEEQVHRLLNGGGEFLMSLPSTGPYLRLLTSARSHLVSLLSKTKYKEAPLYLLRERWDGGIAADDPASKAKKYRGEFVGILPGKTRKWKQFYGLNFDWVLAESVGAGLVEVFETGSVGRGVRAV